MKEARDGAAAGADGGGLTFRRAERADLPALVAMLADDVLGAGREVPSDALDDARYEAAFEAIDADPRQLLLVVEQHARVVGTLQLSFLPYLTFRGGERAQIEAVRVDAVRRGDGIGRAMLLWAIDHARRRGCHMVQLTTDKRRPDAKRFYESLGFAATHEGMKLHL